MKGVAAGTNSDPDNTLGAWRKRHGLITWRSAADALGCSINTIRRWESEGLPKTPSLLCRALDMLADEGLPWPGEVQPDKVKRSFSYDDPMPGRWA